MWKKWRTNNHGLGLASSARGEKLVTLLCILCFCGLTRACTRAKLPQAKSNADLSSRVGQPGMCRSTCLSSRLSDFCWLVFSLPYSHLLTDFPLTALSCRLCLGPSFLRPLPVSLEASPLYGFRAKTDKGILWLVPKTTETNANGHVTIYRHGQLLISCIIPSGSPSPLIRVYSIPFVQVFL